MQPGPAAAQELSLLEEELLSLLALGHTNAEVAELCGVSLRTVEARRARLRQTLGRHTRAELVQYAREAGLLLARRSLARLRETRSRVPRQSTDRRNH